MSLRARILLNAGSGWVSLFISAAISLLMVPIIMSSVKVAGYGVWALLAYGLNYITILDIAFTLAVTRFVATHRENELKRNEIVSTSLLILMAASALVLGCMVFLSFFLTNIFSAIPKEFALQAQWTCILVGATVAIRVMGNSFGGVLQGYQFYTRFNLISSLGTLLRMGFVMALLHRWQSIVAVQLGYVAAEIVTAILMCLVARKTVPTLRVSFFSVTRESMKELFSYTAHSFARSGSTVILYSSLVLLLGWRGTASQIAAYDVASKMSNFLRGIMDASQTIFLPTVSTLAAKNEMESVRSIVKKASLMNATISLCLITVLFAYTDEILAFWLHGKAPGEAPMLMRLLLLAVLPCGMFDVWVPVLAGLGYLRGMSLALPIMAATGILTAFVFIITGIISPPFAVTIALLLAFWSRSGFWLPIYGTRKLTMKMSEYLRASAAGPLAAAAISGLATWALKHLQALHLPVFLIFVLTGLVVMAIFALVAARQETVAIATAVIARLRNENRAAQ